MKRALPFLLLGGLLVLGWLFSTRSAPAAKPAAAPPPAGETAKPAGPPATDPVQDRPVSVGAEPVRPADLAALITRALRNGTPAEHDHALNVLIPRLVAADPAAAGHLALAWDAGLLRDDLLGRVIRNWAEEDIGGALTWLTSLLDSADRHLASEASTKQVARTDPAGALDLALALRVGLDDGSFERLAQLWAEEYPADAVNWAVRQSGGPMRDRLLARIAHVRAQQEPAEAARLVLDHMAPGTARDAAVLAVVRQWAIRDHAGAALWVEQFSAGPLRTQAVGELETARKLVRE